MNQLLARIDALIDKYKKEHNGEQPLYIILSIDANKDVMESIKQEKSLGSEQIITEYKGIKLAQHPHLTGEEIYVSNELPETGS